MKKKGINPMIIGAVVCALGAIYLVYYMQQQAAAESQRKMAEMRADMQKQLDAKTGGNQPVEIKSEVDMVDAVFATQEIPSNGRIEGVFLEVKPMPKDLMPNVYENIDDVVGKYARRNIKPNEPLTPDNVAQEFQRMSARMTPGMRAVALPVIARADSTGGFAADGDYVDLIVTGELKGPGIPKDSNFTKTVMQNVKVLYNPAAGDFRTETSSGLRPLSTPEIKVTTTFEVTPEEAEALVLLSSYKNIYMVLRHKDDREVFRSRGVTSVELTTNPNAVKSRIRRSYSKLPEVQDRIQESVENQTTTTDETNEPSPNEQILQP